VTIERAVEKQQRLLDVRLQDRPAGIGISCRVDDAEPGCVIVTRVATGSPAQSAGFRLNDRIQALGGVPLASLAQFHSLVSTQANRGAVDFQIERDGHFQSLRLVPKPRRAAHELTPSSRLPQ
jgi:S1-C subfamily serine protease